MALSDLLDKIESFDYSQVGKPQSFEANGKVVTGQQSFDRPIETPLPIQEVVLGFGPRSLLSAPQGVDFFQGRAEGFTPNMEDTQFRGLNLDTNKSLPAPRITIGSSVVRWPGPVNYFADDYAVGFQKDKSPIGIGPGTTDYNFINDETSTFNVSTQFGAVNYDFPHETDFFGNDDASGFNSNKGPEGIGPGTTDFKNIDGESYNRKPELDSTFTWPSAGNPYEVDFFDVDKKHTNAGFSKEFQTGIGFFPNKPYSKFKTANDPFEYTSYLWDSEYFTYLSDNFPYKRVIDDEENVVETFQSSTSTIYGLSNTSIEYRASAARIDSMTKDDSNFVTTNDDGDASLIEDASLIQDNKVTIGVDANGTSVTIPAGTRSGEKYQYPTSYTSTTILNNGVFLEGGLFGDLPDSITIEPNRLGKFADDVLDEDNKTLLLQVGADGSALAANTDGSMKKVLSGKNQGMGGLETYSQYIRKMSENDSEPFVVRKQGDDWGADASRDLGPSVLQNIIEFFGEGFNALDGIASGFTRGAPGITGRVSRELFDITRKIGVIKSERGTNFLITNFGLQAYNRTLETRVYNPLSLLSNNFVALKRHLLGLEYTDVLKDPLSIIKDKLPSFLQGFFPDDEKADDITPKGRIINQASWKAPYQTDTQLKEQGLAISNALTAGIDLPSFDELKGTGRLIATNPNHYFRIPFPVDPYGQGDGKAGSLDSAKDQESRLKAGVSANTTHTFSDTPLDRQGVVNLNASNKKDYHYLYYGQIKTVANDPNLQYEKTMLSKADDVDSSEFETNSPSLVSPFNQEKNGKINRKFASAPVSNAESSKLDLIDVVDNSNAKGTIGDDINAISYTGYNTFPPLSDKDWIDFAFETPQTQKARMVRRHLHFRASINSLNESISPEYSEQRYLGRPDKYYTYAGVDRDINIDFTLYPKTAQEFPFLLEKLNYLVGLCYPEYSSAGYMIAPYTKFTLGSMFEDAPGYISSLQVNVQDNTTWEIDMFAFPKHITCALTYRYIGNYLPHKFGKHYELEWLNVDTGLINTDNAGSTLTYENEEGVIVNREVGGIFGLDDMIDEFDLNLMQKKLGVKDEKINKVEKSTGTDGLNLPGEPVPASTGA